MGATPRQWAITFSYRDGTNVKECLSINEILTERRKNTAPTGPESELFSVRFHPPEVGVSPPAGQPNKPTGELPQRLTRRGLARRVSM